jgi:hypothetical protein
MEGCHYFGRQGFEKFWWDLELALGETYWALRFPLLGNGPYFGNGNIPLAQND